MEKMSSQRLFPERGGSKYNRTPNPALSILTQGQSEKYTSQYAATAAAAKILQARTLEWVAISFSNAGK